MIAISIKKSYLLKSSDIKVFISYYPTKLGESAQLLKETFKGQNVTYRIQKNQDKQDRSIAAMHQAEQNDWFDRYYWAVIINHDVII